MLIFIRMLTLIKFAGITKNHNYNNKLHNLTWNEYRLRSHKFLLKHLVFELKLSFCKLKYERVNVTINHFVLDRSVNDNHGLD